MTTSRSRPSVARLLAGALLCVSCTGQPPSEEIDGVAGQSRSFTGFVSTVVGDPAPPGGSPTFHADLTTAEGRILVLSADSAPLLAELAGLGTGPVEVEGRFRGSDTTTLWIERVGPVDP
jgi:hypothetical protein